MLNIANFKTDLAQLPARRRCGRVSAADGASIEVTGLGSKARIGDQVLLAKGPDDPGPGGEIVAIGEGKARAMIFDPVEGLGLNDLVWLSPELPLRPCEAWVGRVIDAYGRPLDGKPLEQGPVNLPVRRNPLPAATRRGLGGRLSTGLSVTDTLLPIAHGQRVGIFAGSGVGKSQFLIQLARGLEADVVVFALIGERGRELNEFLDNGLGEAARARSLVVAATSDQSPLMRRRALWTAMTVAEDLRDRGRHVLLLVDSLTRFAEAHREIALTAGETPSLRAFPPSTTNLIAGVAERAGPGANRSDCGDITAVFSVLVAGSDMEEPVADITRGILDGHVILDRTIAERGRFPAVDVLRSVSRSLPAAASAGENKLITEVRTLLSIYEGARPMVQTGLYQSGSDAKVDRAIAVHDHLDNYFGSAAPGSPGESFTRLAEILGEMRQETMKDHPPTQS